MQRALHPREICPGIPQFAYSQMDRYLSCQFHTLQHECFIAFPGMVQDVIYEFLAHTKFRASEFDSSQR